MVELKAERQKIEDLIAELEEKKQGEREELEIKDRQAKFSEIYEKNTGTKVIAFIFTLSIINRYKFLIFFNREFIKSEISFIRTLDYYLHRVVKYIR